MKMPGRRLRAFAARLCDPIAMQRVIDPLIADLQHEFADALRQDSAWRAIRVRLGGYAGFWTTLLLQILVGRSWNPADHTTVRRVLLISVLVTAAVTALLEVPPLLGMGAAAKRQFDSRLILYLMPQAIPLSLPIGLAFGIVAGIRGHAAPWVVRTILASALAASLVSFVTVGWVMPEANQSFRVLIAREHGGRIERGINELSLGELSKRIDRIDPFSALALRLRHAYHRTYTLSMAPMVLSLLALGIVAATRRRWLAIASGIAGIVAYWAAFVLMETFVRAAPELRVAAPWLPDVMFTSAEAMKPAVLLPLAAAWLPNAVFILFGVLLLKFRSPAPVPLT